MKKQQRTGDVLWGYFTGTETKKAPVKKLNKDDLMKDLILGKTTPKQAVKKGLIGLLNNIL